MGTPACHIRAQPEWRWLAVVGAAVALVLALGLPVRAAGPTPPKPSRADLGKAVLNPLGIVLAAVFVALMASLFTWMFRVPPALSPVAVKARQSVSALQRILVPLPERFGYERAVEVACRLGAAQKAEIILAHVVEVPLTVSLDAPMPAEEARGQEILGSACSIVRRYGLPVRVQVTTDRSAASGVLRLAQNEMVDAIVLSVGREGGSDGIGRTANELLRRAECEVILDRAGKA